MLGIHQAARLPVPRLARGAFTLVELLVVILIIGLLATLLTPSLIRVTQSARTVKCLSQLGNIAKAAESYSANNMGVVPRGCDATAGHGLFAARFLLYLGKPHVPLDKDQDWDFVYQRLQGTTVFRCPSVEKDTYVLTYVTNAVPFEYYNQNNSYPTTSSGAAASSQMARLPGAAAEIAYIIEANLNVLGIKDFPEYDVWKPDHMTFNGQTVKSSPRSIHAVDDRHQGDVNILFFDGNARTRKLKYTEVPVTLFNPLDRTAY